VCQVSLILNHYLLTSNGRVPFSFGFVTRLQCESKWLKMGCLAYRILAKFWNGLWDTGNSTFVALCKVGMILRKYA